ncbi:MAG: prephenate dehydrogenase/arogenate dehydrogenase family protein [Veillonella sp.]|uniref:prephenate dehydrogenase n=1 Tax=Veillonella caviae TaxID=248316 RepID=UPI000F8E04EB|nr:prephenate dehydrogenase/arogenate dehydrogenase family protein [Veillonella caviae]MCF0158337.1 prephenate dehydrogenase/arogenate dehydrogenase family protein [Veillonella sp.]
MNKTVGIIGLGLLGGSLAKALKAYTDYNVVGYARRCEVCDAALQDGVVSQAWTDVELMIKASDIIVFSLPPDTNASLFREVAHLLEPGQIVTDVSSAKANFVHAVYETIPRGVSFVSVHPMAGSEKGGYEVSHKNLFKGMGWIILEDPTSDVYDAEVADELEAMGRAVGSRIERVGLYEHDEYLAMVSHMPHLMAAMLTNVAGGDELGEFRMRLSAGGFRDCTRVAGGLPSMWREIIYGNRHNVLLGLSKIQEEIEAVKPLLEVDDDGAALEAYLEKCRDIRNELPYLTGQIRK